MNKKIKIVTGKVQSGKTSRLFTFVNSNKSVDGILAPIVNETRKLYHISSKTIKELEVDEPTRYTVSVGKYHFLNDSFLWANNKILESYKSVPTWLIIDELGKLEIENKGLHSAASAILNDKKNINVNLILVIRDYLLDKMLEHYKINKEDYEIMNI